MMKKNMKKMAGLLVMAMSLSIGGAFAAAPAFDTPQEWLAACQQQKANKLKEEASMHGYSENYDYMAGPAFDTPQEGVKPRFLSFLFLITPSEAGT